MNGLTLHRNLKFAPSGTLPYGIQQAVEVIGKKWITSPSKK